MVPLLLKLITVVVAGLAWPVGPCVRAAWLDGMSALMSPLIRCSTALGSRFAGSAEEFQIAAVPAVVADGVGQQ